MGEESAYFKMHEFSFHSAGAWKQNFHWMREQMPILHIKFPEFPKLLSQKSKKVFIIFQLYPSIQVLNGKSILVPCENLEVFDRFSPERKKKEIICWSVLRKTIPTFRMLSAAFSSKVLFIQGTCARISVPYHLQQSLWHNATPALLPFALSACSAAIVKCTMRTFKMGRCSAIPSIDFEPNEFRV